MAVIHLGTEVTLATIPQATINNGDIAYIDLNDCTRKMVFDSVSERAHDIVNHPYYVRPDDYDVGVWIEDVGADQPQAWNGAQIRTGIIKSINWEDGIAGTMLDLDGELLAIKNGTFAAAGIQIGWISGAAKIYVGDGANKYIKWDGVDLTWKAAHTELDASGNLVATNVNLTGTITATLGNIGGFTIGAASITSTLIGLHSAGYAEGAEILLGHATLYASAKIAFKADGSGKLASGNIAWDADGAITMAGSITSSATITGGTLQTAPSGARSVLNSAGLAIYDATAQRAKIGSDGAGWLGASNVFSWTTAGVVNLSGFTPGGSDITVISGGNTVTISSGATAFLAGPTGSPTVTITQAGVLNATGANISGAITGSTIDIGGSDTTSFHVDVNGNLWLGAVTYDIATNPFAVSNAGVMRAVSGTIGGWTLSSTALTGTSSILKSSGVLSLGTGADSYLTANRIYIDGPNNKMSVGTTFKVENGVITATSGTIGGWTLGATSLTSTNIGLHSGASAQILLGHATDYASAKIGLKNDGSGKLAGGGITWTAAGNVTIGDATRYIKYDGFLTINVDANVGTGTGVIYKGGKRWLYDFNPAWNGTVTPNGFNLFLGVEAGNLTMGSTATITSQSSFNIGIGYQTLFSNTTGNYSIGIGYQSLYFNNAGCYNIGIGPYSLYSNTTGNENVTIGPYSLYSNTTGNQNVAVGIGALFSNTTGHYDIALGIDAGRYIANGTANQTSNTSVYLGANTRAYANGDSNEIVIGYAAIGNGSNSVTLGNTSIASTYLQGNIIITTGKYIGLDNAASKARIYFEDAATDTISFWSCAVGIGVLPYSGCKLHLKGIGTTSSTYGLICHDSNSTACFYTMDDGSVWIKSNCSALSFTDRTPFFDGDALTAIAGIKGIDGKIDHSTLPEFARHYPTNPKDEPERDIGAMVSILTRAAQQLSARLEIFENKHLLN